MSSIPHRWRRLAFLAAFYASLLWSSAESLFIATPLTREEFTSGIEGPACDRMGNIDCVGFRDPRNIARVTPDGQVSLFVELPENASGNGIRFAPNGTMYIADYTGHRVLRIKPGARKASVLALEPRMNQPNDLAISPTGTLYASDPHWKNGTGQLWRISRHGKTHLEAKDLGTSNGVEVSPDGKHLYVNESVQRNIWIFDIQADGSLKNRRLFKKFDDFGFDGMRCDIDGNLYVTRHGKGTVVKLSPQAEMLQEVGVLGSDPTNLCFGGPDGRTVYVTEAKTKRIVQFRVDRPGQEWIRWKGHR